MNRLVTGPNSKARGRLSVMTQYYCNVTPILGVPPLVFAPVLKVNSAVVRLVSHTTVPYPVKDVRTLSRIATEAFSQHHKTVRSSFGSLFGVKVLMELGIDSAMRVENTSIM